MQITEEKTEQALILNVSGRIDSKTAPDLQSQLMASVSHAPTILVDLADTEYMSSAGLRVILMGAKACKKDQRGFGLCCVQAPVREVLQISGFLSIIDAYPTRDEALAVLSG